MLSYMDFVQRCFFQASRWDPDGSYEHILKTPQNLLAFNIPQGIKLAVNNRNTTYSYSSLEINQLNRLSGSLAYMYSSVNMDDYYQPSKSVKLQEMIQCYKDVLIPLGNIYATARQEDTGPHHLLYGKIYFPSQLLEGMIIKKFSNTNQLIVKFVNTQKVNKISQSTSIITLYWQKKHKNAFHDFIYSTHESLLGYRCLFHFDYLSPTNVNNKLLLPSKFSTGFEIWYAANTMSPGASICARYTSYMLASTPDKMCKTNKNALHSIKNSKFQQKDQYPGHHNIHINHLLTNEELAQQQQNPVTDSGLKEIDTSSYGLNPFTFTFALNPLLGTIESTYSISSSRKGITLSSKYMFNLYSYESDLVCGAHFLRAKVPIKPLKTVQREVSQNEQIIIKEQSKFKTDYIKEKFREHPIVQAVSDYSIVKAVGYGNGKFIPSVPLKHNTDNTSESTSTNEPSVLSVNTTGDDLISSFKISSSIHKKHIMVAWEGKFKDWLISSGAYLDFNEHVPRFKGYGLELQYTS